MGRPCVPLIWIWSPVSHRVSRARNKSWESSLFCMAQLFFIRKLRQSDHLAVRFSKFGICGDGWEIVVWTMMASYCSRGKKKRHFYSLWDPPLCMIFGALKWGVLLSLWSHRSMWLGNKLSDLLLRSLGELPLFPFLFCRSQMAQHKFNTMVTGVTPFMTSDFPWALTLYHTDSLIPLWLLSFSWVL